MLLFAGFHPEMVYSVNLCVNLRDRLCDVASYVSAQSLDCLDLDEISSFLNWKHWYVSNRMTRQWTSFRPEMVYFANLCGNLRSRLCDVEVLILTGLTRLRSASYGRHANHCSASYGAARWINWIEKGDIIPAAKL